MWTEKVAPKLRELPATRAGLRHGLGAVLVHHPAVGVVPMAGIYADAERINISARKIVRGLYWFETGEILSREADIRINMLNVAQVTDYFNDPDRMAIFNHTRLGIYRDPLVHRTFAYFRAFGADLSVWYLFFYRQNALIVSTGPPP